MIMIFNTHQFPGLLLEISPWTSYYWYVQYCNPLSIIPGLIRRELSTNHWPFSNSVNQDWTAQNEQSYLGPALPIWRYFTQTRRLSRDNLLSPHDLDLPEWNLQMAHLFINPFPKKPLFPHVCSLFINPFTKKPLFPHVCSTSLMKTPREKEQFLLFP